MNITPALPNPYQPPGQQERTVVGAVQAPNRARNAADEEERQRKQAPAADPAGREQMAARAGALVQPHDPALTTKANRAMASYAQVADDNERSGLQDLLGFDAYA